MLSDNALRVLKMLRYNPQLYFGEISKQLDMPIDQVARAVDEIAKAGRVNVHVAKPTLFTKGGAA